MKAKDQLELVLPVKRVQWLPEEPTTPRRAIVGAGDGTSILRSVALAEAELKRRAQFNSVDPELVIGYTDWETQQAPPCKGWWEVTDHKTGMPPVRIWFNGAGWDTSLTACPDKTPSDIVVPHELFKDDYAWRGLRKPWPQGYSWQIPGLFNWDDALNGAAAVEAITANDPPARRVVLL